MNTKIDVKESKLLQEISAGGVVFVEDNGVKKIVTIERTKMNDFCLPKGHQEGSETLQETATREVFEETGYKAEPEEYLGEFTYTVFSSVHKTLTFRTVHWFLMSSKSSVELNPNDEVRKISLTPVDSDFSFLTYDNDRKFIEKAKEILQR